MAGGMCVVGVCAWWWCAFVAGGMHGRGCVHGRGACMAGEHVCQRGVCGRWVCMVRGHAWLGGIHGGMCGWRGAVHGRGQVWRGTGMAGGMCDRGACLVGGGMHGRGEACMAGEMATDVDGMHSTVIHSCFYSVFSFRV